MSEEQLKPCPFCGGEAGMMYYRGGVMKYYAVECKNCYCGTGHEESEEEAIEVWNRRAQNEGV